MRFRDQAGTTKMRLATALTLAVLFAAVADGAYAQGEAAPAKAQRAAGAVETGGRKEPVSELKLSEDEARLVRSSKAAVVATGLSGPYFDRHFRLVKVVNQPGDRQVIWKYSLGEYETTLNDIVGFYTAGGGRVDTHSITGTLGSTYDIRQTIPRPRAEKIMRECLGRYADAAVVYQRLTENGQTGLYLTAQASGSTRRAAGRKEREREERVQREAQKHRRDSTAAGERVEIREEDEEGPRFFIGYVNLECGRGIKAQGIAR
jgi:hypothetical protein